MPQCKRVVIPIVAFILLCIPFASPLGSNFYSPSNFDEPSLPYEKTPESLQTLADLSLRSGVLNPVEIRHTGTAYGYTRYLSARTDVTHSPSTEVLLPAGAPSTYYSAECHDSGYFLVGAGGSADFASPTGTISWWGKWDGSAPHGRFWGQDNDLEMRWSSNRIALDWGSDNTLLGSKTDWLVNHWYFFAITWNETSNYLMFCWGDESTPPQIDAATSVWLPSLAGIHTRNCIMNSEVKTDYVEGHIDEFRYYTLDRNLEDISVDYRQKLSGDEPGLSNYYQFENDLSDTAGDEDLQASGSYDFSHDVFSRPDGWKAEQLEVNVMNLRRLYALNGSFDSGIPGVNVDWLGDGTYRAEGWLSRREVLDYHGRQRAGYDVSGYVSLENEGWLNTTTDAFQHYNGTRIFWYQNVSNPDYNDQFLFDMNYLYQSGPIGSNFRDVFELRFEIRDGSQILWNWSQDLVNLTQRQTWFSPGPLQVNLTYAPAFFEVRVVLAVNYTEAYLEISETDPDLDGDTANGQFVRLLIDDVSLIGASDPTCQNVALTVSTAQTGPISLTGLEGSGFAHVNFQYWNESSIPILFSSNTTISFDYSAKVSKMTRFLSSLSTSSPEELGVTYSIEPDKAVNLTLYTYVASYPEAEALGLVVYHPESWENATLEDPFGNNDPGPIGTGTNYFEVPAGVIDSVGWWVIRMNGHNYAKDITTQKSSESETSWSNATRFLSGDRFRCLLTIGTSFDSPSSVMNVEFDILLPSLENWAESSLSNASGNILRSSEYTFGSYNASIGEWTIVSFWINGSTIAYGHCHFELVHHLTMFAHNPYIEPELGENFTIAVYIHDQETGELIIHEDAEVVGNWSGEPNRFSPNLAKGWWEADFNSSLVGVGNWVITVSASVPYYTDSNCSIDVQITSLTLMTTLGDYYVELSPGASYAAKFRYMFLDGTGIEEAVVSVVSWSGPDQGIDIGTTEPVLGEPGNYTIEFTGILSGTYFITVSGERDGYRTATTSFYLIVGAVSTELQVSGDDLPEDLFFNQTYSFTLFYSAGGYGIEGASMNITHNPVVIVDWIELGEGYYSITLRVPHVGSNAIYIRLFKYGYAYADLPYSFNVLEIPTSVSSTSFEEYYYESRRYEFSLFYNSTIENGVIGATLTPSSSIHGFYRFTGSSNGWYNFTLSPISGDWNATFWLSKPGFQEQEFSFTLRALKIPIQLATGQLNPTYTRPENSLLNLELTPFAEDTGFRIRGAIIQFALYDTTDGDTLVNEGAFTETLTCYYANISVPEAGLYLIRITISKSHYETIYYDIVLNSEVDPQSIIVTSVTSAILGALALFVVLTVTLVSRRFYTATVSRRNLELLNLKGRIEDSKNLIGLLIIHRKVGLPVYSRILKGGFQESMISSFIAAISQFRSEFSWDEPIWAAIPITEVITAVQTEVLICAIITLEPASVRQKGQLEAFGRDVGGLYDHEDDTLRAMFHTPELSEAFTRSFDPIFDSYFDGPLIERYVGVKKTLPKHLAPVTEAISSLNIDYGVTVEAIIKAVSLKGYSELVAHRLTFEAVDGDFLIRAEKKLPIPSDFSELV